MTATVTDVNLWTYFTLSGVPSPGSIPKGGVRGFKRQTGWDIKRGKGTKGATLTLKDRPPCEGTITLQLVGPGGLNADGSPSSDFQLWDLFVAAVLSFPAEKQAAKGLSIFYPQFASIDLTDVVVKHFTGPEHVGKGLYTVQIELIEWTPPPAVSIVSTVAATAPDNATPDQVPKQDPRIAALQAQIAAAQQAAQP